jgi:hypothetical protein
MRTTLLRHLTVAAACALIAAPGAIGQSLTAEAPADHPSQAPELRGQILHAQVDGFQSTGIISQYNQTQAQFDNELADDFLVPEGETWNVSSIFVRGFLSGPQQGVPPSLENCPEAYVFFWEDDANEPGELLAERTVMPEGAGGEMTATFEPVSLNPGRHWVSYVCFGPGLDINVEDRWNWFVNADEAYFQPAHIRNQGGGFGDGAFVDWTSFDGLGFPGNDLDWYISGEAGPVSGEAGPQTHVFSGLRNFPNPAAGSTQVQFELDAGAEVSVTVYDALGRRVMEAFSGTMQPGQRSVTVDVSTLPSGTYLYRVQSGSQMMVRKMTVVN